MSVRSSSQKFDASNRAPCVQIAYDVEIYGSQKKVQVPFVMGVMSDLSGANTENLPALEAREAVEIARSPSNSPDPARPAVPGAGRRMARPALSGEQHQIGYAVDEVMTLASPSPASGRQLA
ncbi:type VI secretion system contractile sheath small subunit [Xanthomonas campestris pv. trichodesmae]|uniref:Type VI secretion system contractile sheath small subunit n=1 Tax=Xanthomonas citri pv. vignicola TaxID=473426 RepID=A0AB33CKT2_XANCI|nr:hypothetical protein XcvCFBP7111P_12065 [Xanthomonas citri pv. vignicola]MBV6781180.1 type VI secretion system contractile sheath small subunit [Xanthomonas campestris pv. trichodesmae]